MKPLRITFVILLALFATAHTPAGQNRTGARASKIVGTVVDKNGARIVGAVVKIENTRVGRAVMSDTQGVFEVELPAGAYQMTVEMDGFKKFELSAFRVKAGARKTISVQMEVKRPQSTLKV
ncbi:MAG TPA: carboxypeptidase-like regulatory domain-containing protein [Pyrinomonadaceae bacterium]|nr:carboxypeptidase-like regulatory domain-containing protein [Pyrinomonadaceae bacterium]